MTAEADVLHMLLLGRRLLELARQAIREPTDDVVGPAAKNVLEELTFRPGSSVEEIADRIRVTPAEVSEILADEQLRSWAELVPDPDDPQRILVWPSAELLVETERRVRRPLDTELADSVPDPAQRRRCIEMLAELADLMLPGEPEGL
ncbi:MarR family transcriptional regulator [Nocardia sp. NPDC127579]|uniref:MarR family transcriptional regulator n=1 Tax=Nocardia sp. NPDC127579 TaxID=3345402 RepID=UPI00362DCCB3